MRGRGSKIDITEDENVWQAGAGVAFTFELFERRLRLKPSVEYQRRKLTVETTANEIFTSSDVGTRQTPTAPKTPPAFNIIQLAATDELVIDGLGPGLEVEMDTWMAGPFMLSLYISGQAYYALGDTKIDNRGAGRFEDCDDQDGGNLARLCQRTFDFPSQQVDPSNLNASGVGFNDIWGDFKFEIDPWSYQAGVGVRFRALPEQWFPDSVSSIRMPSWSSPSWLPW